MSETPAAPGPAPQPDPQAGPQPSLPGPLRPEASPRPLPAPPAPERGSCVRRLVVTGAVGALLVVLGPWLLTHSVLTAGLRRSLVGVAGPQAGIGRASLGWRTGLALEQLLLPEPPAGSPAVLMGELRVETDLVSGARGWWFGTPVSGRLVLRRTAIEYVVPPANLAAPPAAGGEAPPRESAPGAPLELPCPLLPSLDLSGLDLVTTWTPGGASPRRATLRQMQASGGGQVERDLGLDLDQGFECRLEELRLERLAGPEGPAETLLAVDAPTFSTRRLKLPPLALFATREVVTDMAVQAPVLRAGGVRLTDLVGTLAFADGRARIGLGAAATQGKFELETTLDLRDAARWPMDLRVQLRDVQLTGDLAQAAPYLVPLLRAHRTSGGQSGLPPVTLELAGKLELLFDPAGALDTPRSLDTLTGQGVLRLGGGQLSSSLLIDGYLRALTGLGVASLLRGLIPAGWPTTGVEARFELPGQGRVRLPGLVVRSGAVDLEIAGETRFTGELDVTVKTLGEGKAGVPALLEAIDDAGGIRLQGNLATGEVRPVLPDASALLEAARRRGVLELIQQQVTGGALKEALQKLPVPGLPR